MKSLRIGMAFDLTTDYKINPKDPKDRYYEFDTPYIVAGYGRALEKHGHTVSLLGGFDKIRDSLDDIKKSVDIVFNTTEGLYGRNREARVPMILEYAGIPYMGSDALTLSLALDKVMTKRVLVGSGIPTPKFLVAGKPVSKKDIEAFTFPLIVKPRWEGSSMGITPKSKVNSLEELNTQITELVLGYHEPVLVEEFISGREFTIAILGNGPEAKALPNLEIVIRGKPVGKKAYLGRYVYSNDVNYVHETDSHSDLGKKVESLALATFHAVDALDLSRVDIRVDEKGNPFVLEINPLPALSKQDAFGILAKLGGKTYDEMLNTIILTAAARYNLV